MTAAIAQRLGLALCAQRAPLAVLALLAGLVPGLAGAGELTVRLVDAAGAPLEGAVLVAMPLADVPPAAGPLRALIDQVDKRFVPRVSVLRTGTAVSFPNHDNIRHSIYSYSQPKRFELKLYAGTPSSPVVFDRPGVVTLGCNIHDAMIAWVLVVDTPWSAQSDAQGNARIADLPPGRYRLRAWREPMAELTEGETLVVGDAPLHRAVTLEPERPPAAPGP
jgi:plastocyanin